MLFGNLSLGLRLRRREEPTPLCSQSRAFHLCAKSLDSYSHASVEKRGKKLSTVSMLAGPWDSRTTPILLHSGPVCMWSDLEEYIDSSLN